MFEIVSLLCSKSAYIASSYLSKWKPKISLGFIFLVFSLFTNRLYYPCFGMETALLEEKTGGLVASGNPLSTQSGLKILARGGNAFDAAVAIWLTNGVVDCALSGLGGYGSLQTFHVRQGETRYLNANGCFPRATDASFMTPNSSDYLLNRKGEKAIGAPASLRAYEMMHREYGCLPWDELFCDAIHYAREGFRIDAFTAKVIELYFEDFPTVAKRVYSNKQGEPLGEGEVLIQEDLARTLERIAGRGAHDFYEGGLAAKIAAKMEEVGSFLALEDLENTKPKWHDNVSLQFGDYEIRTPGAPGNAYIVLLILGIMNEFSLEDQDFQSAAYHHLLIEAFKAANQIRLSLPGSSANQERICDELLLKENFAKVAQSIDRNLASMPLCGEKEGKLTTHYVVRDAEGNIVSSTQTLGKGFGSKVWVEGTGIWMNNSLAFSNYEQPGNPMEPTSGGEKLSSNAPTMIFHKGELFAAIGSPGGHTIPQSLAQVVINFLVRGMTLQDAIDAPRVAFLVETGVVKLEDGISKPLVDSLVEMGHSVVQGEIGNVMGIAVCPKGGNPSKGVDRRRDGWSTQNISD